MWSLEFFEYVGDGYKVYIQAFFPSLAIVVLHFALLRWPHIAVSLL